MRLFENFPDCAKWFKEATIWEYKDYGICISRKGLMKSSEDTIRSSVKRMNRRRWCCLLYTHKDFFRIFFRTAESEEAFLFISDRTDPEEDRVIY